MPELREVFEMVTKQAEPEVDAWRDQERRQRRNSRNRKLGALAAAAAIGILAGVVIVTNLPGGSDIVPVDRPSLPATTETPDRFFLDLRTGAATPLPREIPDGVFYAPSPDGTMLATTPCCVGGGDPVWVSNIDGTGIRMLTPEDSDGYGPHWSPDGSMLVYQGREGSTTELGNLFVVDVTSGETTQITNLEPASHGSWFMTPSFSADGRTVIFHMPRGNGADTRWDVWTVPVAGGEPTLVVPDASSGVYGPDGEQLAYVDSPRGISPPWSSPRLMVADADGSAPRILVRGDEIAFPRWSPGGTSIAYVDGGEIFIVDVSSGASTRVADGGWVEWLDDYTLVISPP